MDGYRVQFVQFVDPSCRVSQSRSLLLSAHSSLPNMIERFKAAAPNIVVMLSRHKAVRLKRHS